MSGAYQPISFGAKAQGSLLVGPRVPMRTMYHALPIPFHVYKPYSNVKAGQAAKFCSGRPGIRDPRYTHLSHRALKLLSESPWLRCRPAASAPTTELASADVFALGHEGRQGIMSSCEDDNAVSPNSSRISITNTLSEIWALLGESATV